jgi:hypothetical protein
MGVGRLGSEVFPVPKALYEIDGRDFAMLE